MNQLPYGNQGRISRIVVELAAEVIGLVRKDLKRDLTRVKINLSRDVEFLSEILLPDLRGHGSDNESRTA